MTLEWRKPPNKEMDPKPTSTMTWVRWNIEKVLNIVNKKEWHYLNKVENKFA